MSKSEAEIELNVVLETMVDGAIIIDSKGIIQSFNPASVRIFGYEAAEVIGRNVSCLMLSPDKERHDAFIEAYVASGNKKIIGIGREVKGLKKDGRAFPMELSVGEANTAKGRYFIGIFRDLTRRTEDRLRFEQLQAEHFHLSRVASMNQMASTIAHEINQPLTAAFNYLEAIDIMLKKETGGITDEIAPILNKSKEQIKRASNIISRMRQFIERGEVEKSGTPVKPLIETSKKLAIMPFKDAAIVVEKYIGRDVDAVHANAIQIQQVLVNIIQNACESMASVSDRKLVISVSKAKDKGFVQFDIADNGVGITEPEMERLFLPFNSNKKNGMGVGLSISHSIIREHGGSMWAEQNHPNGMVFSFTLPTAR